jgi:hypothetical protein
MPRSERQRLVASPVCPAPMTTVVTFVMMELRGDLGSRLQASGRVPCPESRARSLQARSRFSNALYTNSTLTVVGLVMMSNTAERFCDWATIASISFFDASASMLKVTLMSS